MTDANSPVPGLKNWMPLSKSRPCKALLEPNTPSEGVCHAVSLMPKPIAAALQQQCNFDPENQYQLDPDSVRALTEQQADKLRHCLNLKLWRVKNYHDAKAHNRAVRKKKAELAASQMSVSPAMAPTPNAKRRPASKTAACDSGLINDSDGDSLNIPMVPNSDDESLYNAMVSAMELAERDMDNTQQDDAEPIE